jgi:hypothetical protein
MKANLNYICKNANMMLGNPKADISCNSSRLCWVYVCKLLLSWSNKEQASYCCYYSQSGLSTFLTFLHLFSKSDHNIFYGDSLTVAYTKSLVHYIHQKKSDSSTSKWPSSVEKNDANKNIVKYALLHWQEHGIFNSKKPTEANVCANPHHYLKRFHIIQVGMNKKQFIQDNIPQKTANSGYIHRNLKSIENVSIWMLKATKV